MNSWIDITKVVPGIKGLYVHAVNMHIHDLEAALKQSGFEVIVIDGAKINDERSFLEEVAKSFRFPDYFGHNWSAWSDCLTDFQDALPGNNVAIIWEAADQLVSRDLQVFTQAICDLYNLAVYVAFRHAKPWPQKRGPEPQQQIEIFLLGQGSGFNKLAN